MRKFFCALGVALGLSLLAGPVGATDDDVKAPCTAENVDCGDWPEVIPPGTHCKVHYQGEWLEGETDENGVCVCEYVPPTTTSSTVPETTSTTIMQPSTTVTTILEEHVPSTTVAVVDNTIRTEFVAKPAAAGRLPNTGSNTGPMVAVGLGLCAAGGGLMVLAHRRRLTA